MIKMKEIIMAIVVALGILFGGLSVGVLIGREQSKKENVKLNELLTARQSQLKALSEMLTEENTCKKHGVSWPHSDTIHDTVFVEKKIKNTDSQYFFGKKYQRGDTVNFNEIWDTIREINKKLELKVDKENGLTSKMESNLLFK